MKTICILGSNFYGYEKEIINELKKENKVIFINYRLNIYEFILSKILGKKIKTILINKKLEKIPLIKLDILLVIGGQELYKENIDYLNKKYLTAKKILYLWDNIERVKNFKEIRNMFDKIFSFDMYDCKKYLLKYRPTFYSKRLEILEKDNLNENINLFFIGIYRKNRLNFLKDLYKENNYIYLYYPRLFFYLLKFLRKDEFKNISSKYINFKNISKEKYNELFMKAKYIIDIPEENQSGLTQRVLDALYLKKKIITTQKNIKEEKFYNKNNILVIEKVEDLYTNKDFFKAEYDMTFYKNINYYSIENWKKTILDEE